MPASPTHDLLLEIGTEDLPARFVAPLSEALEDGLVQGLARRGVVAAVSRRFGTPRRVAVWVSDIAERQPDQSVERLGPALAAAIKDGKPTPAALGFARSCGVEFLALGQKDGKLFFSKTAPGRMTRDLIPEIFEETLKQMDELVPKRMRWGSGDETFVRPVEWLCCLLGREVVPLRRFGLDAGRLSYGHRFHAPEPLTLAVPADYAPALLQAYVQADVAARKAVIRTQIETQATRLGGHARITENLLDEVTALVEWPVAITGHFEERFKELPPEVIVATVETNQRYFTVFEDAAHTRMTNAFITVSNIESRDVAQVIQGNERVVRPRLTDALFFWRQDAEESLQAMNARLSSLTYLKGLGAESSMAHKAGRISALAKSIAEQAMDDPRDAPEIAEKAGLLCKADLVSKLVFEFPELQGTVGGYLGTRGRSPIHPDIAAAISEHYLPRFAGDSLPSTLSGAAVALADKIDHILCVWMTGGKPTASKDPFALRRAALGVLRIPVALDKPWDLRKMVLAASSYLPSSLSVPERVIDEVVEFLSDRQRAAIVGESIDGRPVAVETFESVNALALTQPLDFYRRVEAVHRFVALREARNLAAANKRIRNILKQAGVVESHVDPAKFEHVAEGTLFETMNTLATRNAAITDYTTKLVNLASLRAPVDAFFEGVMVNVENPAVRANRLALLRQLDAMCREVADLSCLPG
ncbi:MAG: glycine--tRNA ligase subunit beta [Panacagrimonas sp.]